MKITENIKEIYLYDDEYIMIIEVPQQRKVDYRLVRKEVYDNLKNSDLDFFNSSTGEDLIESLNIKSFELAQRLNDLNNYYIISNDCFDESQFLDDLENSDNICHKKSEIISLLNRMRGKE
jgi:hypothetical protein